MYRRRSARSVVSDALGSLPVPQALTAYPQDWVNGPSHTFLIEKNCPFSGQEIENLLTSHGIRVWGKMIVFGEIMFTVRRAQAGWAQYLLERAGVPIQRGSEFCTGPGLRSRSLDGPWEQVLQLLDRLMDKLGL